MIFSGTPALRVRRPVVSGVSKWADRNICQSCCPWSLKFSQALAEDSPFRARELIAETDAVTLSSDMFALDQHALSAVFRKSPMKRAKLRGLQQNAAVVITNVGVTELSAARPAE